MGSVYLATCSSGGFTKIVALKRIHDHLARDRKFVEMFLDEARVAARISHPNVCSVFDFGDIGGTYFIAMEYLMGETFSSIHRALRDRDRSEWVHHLAEIFAQVAEGLHAAHELRGDDGESLGVVHRDVSPQNLFLTYDGCAKVVDFGVARCAGRVLQTEPGTIKGKLAYVAPEQLRCQEIDRRSDVWALGVTLWELLAGRTLFRRGNDIETLQAVVSDEILPPSEADPELPPALDAIVLKALSRDIEQRYQTARELSRALREFNRASMAIVGQAELEEWMASLFPAQQQHKHAMVQAAREASVIHMLDIEANGREPTHTIVHVGPPLHMHDEDARMSPPRAFWAGIGISAAIVVALGGWFVALVRPSAPELDAVANSALTAGAQGSGVSETQGARAGLVPPPLRSDSQLPAAGRAHSRIDGSSADDSRASESSSDDLRSTGSHRLEADVPERYGRRRGGRVAVREPGPAPRPASAVRRAGEASSEHRGPADGGPPGAIDGGATAGPVLVAATPSSPESPRPVAIAAASAAAAPAATPVTPRPTAPSPIASALAPPSPTLDARVVIDALRMGGSIPMSAIRHAVQRVESGYQQCYRAAARRAGRDAAGSVAVRFMIDEMGVPRRVSVTGAALPGLGTCVEAATGYIRPRLRPDTGTVEVSYEVRFAPLSASPGGR